MSGESLTAKLLKNFSASRAESVEEVADSAKKNNTGSTKKVTTFEYDPSDKQKDIFVTNDNDSKKSGSGYTVSGDKLSDNLSGALKEVGGEDADLSKVWVQDNGDNKVTYGFNDADGNKVYVRYELDDDGNATEIKRTVQNKDGSRVSTDEEGKVDSTRDVDSETMDKLQAALGSSYDYSTANMLKEERADGSTTYHVKDSEGNDAWVRYNKDGKEIARTIETKDDERYSIYAEEDANGEDGKTTFIQRKVENGKLVDVEGVYIDSDVVGYDELTKAQSEMSAYSEYYAGLINEDELVDALGLDSAEETGQTVDKNTVTIEDFIKVVPDFDTYLDYEAETGFITDTLYGEEATDEDVDEAEEEMEIKEDKEETSGKVGEQITYEDAEETTDKDVDEAEEEMEIKDPLKEFRDALSGTVMYNRFLQENELFRIFNQHGGIQENGVKEQDGKLEITYKDGVTIIFEKNKDGTLTQIG